MPKKILLVEGKDDKYVVEHIRDYFKLAKSFSIEPQEGKEKLLKVLPVKLKESDIATLGIVLDADMDLKGTWQSLINLLQAQGYQGRECPEKNGMILTPSKESNPLLPRVGIWLMPNNTIFGALEDFLEFLVPPAGNALLQYAKQVIDRLPDTKFKRTYKTKSLMHTWLAWQEEPGRPYGQAITRRYLDVELPIGRDFLEWLKRTFEM